MLISVSLQRISKQVKLWLKIVILFIIICYIIPNLFSLFWEPPKSKIHEQLLEKPLRVELNFLKFNYINKT